MVCRCLFSFLLFYLTAFGSDRHGSLEHRECSPQTGPEAAYQSSDFATNCPLAKTALECTLGNCSCPPGQAPLALSPAGYLPEGARNHGFLEMRQLPHLVQATSAVLLQMWRTLAISAGDGVSPASELEPTCPAMATAGGEEMGIASKEATAITAAQAQGQGRCQKNGQRAQGQGAGFQWPSGTGDLSAARGPFGGADQPSQASERACHGPLFGGAQGSGATGDASLFLRRGDALADRCSGHPVQDRVAQARREAATSTCGQADTGQKRACQNRDRAGSVRQGVGGVYRPPHAAHPGPVCTAGKGSARHGCCSRGLDWATQGCFESSRGVSRERRSQAGHGDRRGRGDGDGRSRAGESPSPGGGGDAAPALLSYRGPAWSAGVSGFQTSARQLQDAQTQVGSRYCGLQSRAGGTRGFFGKRLAQGPLLAATWCCWYAAPSIGPHSSYSSVRGPESSPLPLHSVVQQWDYVGPCQAQLLALQQEFCVRYDDMEWFCEFTDPRLLSGEQLAADCPYAQWIGVTAADPDRSGEFDASFDPLEHGWPRVEVEDAPNRRDADVLQSETYDVQTVQCSGLSCPSEQLACTASALHVDPHPVQMCVCWGGEVQQQVFNRLARSASKALRTGPPHFPSCCSKFPAADTTVSPDGRVDNWAIPVSFAAIRLRLSAQVPVLPEELDRPELRGMCVTSFGWYSGFRATGGVSSTSQHDRFVLFTTEYHSQIRSLRRGATIDDVVAEVLGIVPRLRNIRILMDRLEGFPPLQVVATARDCPIPGHATPLDMRAVGGRVCTLNLFPGFPADRIREMIMQDCPVIRRPTRDFMLRLPDATPFQGMPLLVLGPDHIRGADTERPAPAEPQPPLAAVLPPDPDTVHDDQVALLQVSQHVPGSRSIQPETFPALLDGDDCFTPVSGVHAGGPTILSHTASTTSTTTATTTTPFDQSLFRRPVLIPGVLDQAEILPAGVLVAPGAHLPVADLGLFQLVTRGSAGCTPFLFMVRGCEPVRLEGSRTWTLLDFCAAAASNAECIPRRLQVLTSPIPDLLQPQIVVTDRADDSESVLLPVDLRAAPGGVVLPVLLRHGMSASEVVDAIIAEIPDSRAFFADASVGTDFFFQDVAGFVWTQLPGHLQAIQWLVLRRGSPPTVCPPGVPISTTTTTAGPDWDDVQFAVPAPSAALHTAGRTPALPPPLWPAALSGQPAARPDDMNADAALCHMKVSLVEVTASSVAPNKPSPVVVPPDGPPPDPDRDPRTPPGTARGRSSSRPSNADMIRAAQIRVLPAEVAEAAVYTAPVGAFSWSSASQGPHTGAFSVFDARRHHTVDRAYAHASLHDIVALAVAHAPFQIEAVQILTQPVQGLPQPQLVLKEAGRPPQEFPLVWDLRGIQEPVLTSRHLSREMRDEALQKLQLLFLRDLRAEMMRGTLALFDCLGALPVQFPSDLWAMQHVRATALTGPSVPASSHTGPARPTGVPDTAGRGNRPRIGPVRQHPPGLRLTVLRGHHRFSVDCTFDNGAIDTLVFDLLVQHHNQASLPSTFLLVLSGAQPLRMGYYQEVVFVVQDGSQTATVWDGRHLGQELQVNLHPTTQSTCQVLDADWTRNGWRLFVNGVPEAAAMRHIRVGDYLQPCSGSQCPGVVPLGSLLALCPMLRPYAWPLEVSMTGSGFSASLRKRRKQLGSHRMPEGTARVYGPHHGEIFIQIGTGMTPTALQVDAVLHNLDGFPEGLNVLGTPTRHPHDADFVTRYRYRQDSTALTPAPGHAEHLLVLLVHADTEVLPGVPANPRIMLYPQRGLRHGDVLQQIPEPHFVFGEESEEEHVVSDPAGPPPPVPIFVEQEEPISVLESGDEQAGTNANPPPGAVTQYAASSNEPASALSLLQVRATKHRRNIPTPLGRRSLPIVPEVAPTGQGASDTLCPEPCANLRAAGPHQAG